MPGAAEQTLWIKLIEDDSRGILFSDGTFTAGRILHQGREEIAGKMRRTEKTSGISFCLRLAGNGQAG